MQNKEYGHLWCQLRASMPGHMTGLKKMADFLSISGHKKAAAATVRFIRSVSLGPSPSDEEFEKLKRIWSCVEVPAWDRNDLEEFEKSARFLRDATVIWRRSDGAGIVSKVTLAIESSLRPGFVYNLAFGDEFVFSIPEDDLYLDLQEFMVASRMIQS